MFATFSKGSLLVSMLEVGDYLNIQPAQEITDDIMEFSHFCIQGSNRQFKAPEAEEHPQGGIFNVSGLVALLLSLFTQKIVLPYVQ